MIFKGPHLFMMIGVPGSGKTTYIRTQFGEDFPQIDPASLVVVSTDNHIEIVAAEQGKTYDDVFSSQIKPATYKMNKDLQAAVLANADILWDQTNLTKKSRKGKLLQVPPHYTKVAVFFSIPNLEELQRRLDSRAGKTIPRHVVADMIKSLEEPSLEEGFDLIVKV